MKQAVWGPGHAEPAAAGAHRPSQRGLFFYNCIIFKMLKHMGRLSLGRVAQWSEACRQTPLPSMSCA